MSGEAISWLESRSEIPWIQSPQLRPLLMFVRRLSCEETQLVSYGREAQHALPGLLDVQFLSFCIGVLLICSCGAKLLFPLCLSDRMHGIYYGVYLAHAPENPWQLWGAAKISQQYFGHYVTPGLGTKQKRIARAGITAHSSEHSSRGSAREQVVCPLWFTHR